MRACRRLLLSIVAAMADNGLISATPVAYPGETSSSGGQFTPTHVYA